MAFTDQQELVAKYRARSEVLKEIVKVLKDDPTMLRVILGELRGLVRTGGQKSQELLDRVVAVCVANGNEWLTVLQIADLADVSGSAVHSMLKRDDGKMLERMPVPGVKRRMQFRLKERLYQKALEEGLDGDAEEAALGQMDEQDD